MRQPTRSGRCFSYGGRVADLENVAVWKFDVLLKQGTRVTCYVKRSIRDEAFRTLFARWPKATIFGTGQPLTDDVAMVELGRPIEPGAIVIVHDLAEFT